MDDPNSKLPRRLRQRVFNTLRKPRFYGALVIVLLITSSLLANTTFSRSFEYNVVKLAAYMGESAQLPSVSLIVLAKNHFSTTRKCIQSIIRHTDLSNAEIILVDDASTDETRYFEKHFDERFPIRVVHHQESLGFVQSVNEAIELSKSDYVMLLNNDMLFTAGWLNNLFKVFYTWDSVGMVGGKLLSPDGSLQEACSIIFSDSSTQAWGNRDPDPYLSSFNYVREADYCSGCFILIKRKILDEIGNLDERFIPAYFEDTDVATQIHERGYRVMYTPFSVAYHIQTLTYSAGSGTSPREVLHNTNKAKFREKWSKFLLDKNYSPPDTPFARAKDHWTNGRVLVIDRLPHPDLVFGQSRVMNIVLSIRRKLNHQVTLLPEKHPRKESSDQTVRAFQENGVEYVYSRQFSSYPENFIHAMARDGPLGKCPYSAIFIPFLESAELYTSSVRSHCPNTRIIFDFPHSLAERVGGSSRFGDIRPFHLDNVAILVENEEDLPGVKATFPSAEVHLAHSTMPANIIIVQQPSTNRTISALS